MTIIAPTNKKTLNEPWINLHSAALHAPRAWNEPNPKGVRATHSLKESLTDTSLRASVPLRLVNRPKKPFMIASAFYSSSMTVHDKVLGPTSVEIVMFQVKMVAIHCHFYLLVIWYGHGKLPLYWNFPLKMVDFSSSLCKRLPEGWFPIAGPGPRRGKRTPAYPGHMATLWGYNLCWKDPGCMALYGFVWVDNMLTYPLVN